MLLESCVGALTQVNLGRGVAVRTRAGICRSHSVGVLGAGSSVGVAAGLLLRTLARVVCELYFLSLLATVRGGTSFLGPSSATKKRSKENAFQQSVLSVPSVQTTAFGSRVERCSLEPRFVETLLLANPDIPTLRHQCSRASSVRLGLSRFQNVFGTRATLLGMVTSRALLRLARGAPLFFLMFAQT